MDLGGQQRRLQGVQLGLDGRQQLGCRAVMSGASSLSTTRVT